MTAVGRKDILILGGFLDKGERGSVYKYDVEANELQEVIACVEVERLDSEESEGDNEE